MVICPYCNKEAEFLTSYQFYGVNYGTNLYVCRGCDARVGTHGRGKTPKGSLANAELRALRMRCHALIDPFWKQGKYSRTTVYKRMAKAMGLTSDQAHIGMFNKEQCLQLMNFFK